MQDTQTSGLSIKMVFSILLVALIVAGVYYYLSSRPATSIPAPTQQVQVIEKTFTGLTYDQPRNGTKSVTYTLRYPSPTTLAQQMNNEGSQISIPGSLNAVLLTISYMPKVASLNDAWKAYFTKAIKPVVGTATPQKVAASSITISGTESVHYTLGDKDFVMLRFRAHPEWFFVFEIRATSQRDVLFPVAETLTITSSK